MTDFTLDQIDRAILRTLQTDGGLSQSELAQRVGASQASCWRRVKALENVGVLGKTVRLINPKAVGKSLNAFCHVKMKSHARASREDFEAFVASHKEVVGCYSMSGEWDYLMHVVIGDIGEYESFLMRGILSHDAISNSATNFALKTVKHTTALPI